MVVESVRDLNTLLRYSGVKQTFVKLQWQTHTKSSQDHIPTQISNYTKWEHTGCVLVTAFKYSLNKLFKKKKRKALFKEGFYKMITCKLKMWRFCNLLLVTENMSFQFFTQSVSLYYFSNLFSISCFTCIILGELLLAIIIYHGVSEMLCALIWERTVSFEFCWTAGIGYHLLLVAQGDWKEKFSSELFDTV